MSHLTEGEAALRRARMKIYADEKAVSVREATRRPDAVKSEPSLHKVRCLCLMAAALWGGVGSEIMKYQQQTKHETNKQK